MSAYGEMAKVSNDIAKELCENDKVEKYVSGAVPALVGGAVGIATCNPVLGMGAASIVASFVAVPALIGYGLFKAIFKND